MLLSHWLVSGWSEWAWTLVKTANKWLYSKQVRSLKHYVRSRREWRIVEGKIQQKWKTSQRNTPEKYIKDKEEKEELQEEKRSGEWRDGSIWQLPHTSGTSHTQWFNIFSVLTHTCVFRWWWWVWTQLESPHCWPNCWQERWASSIPFSCEGGDFRLNSNLTSRWWKHLQPSASTWEIWT